MLPEPTPEFREALRKQVERPQERLDEAFTSALVALAHAAKSAGMTAEQLVILVKHELEGLERAGAASHGTGAGRDALRDRLVTAAIKAYYVQ